MSILTLDVSAVLIALLVAAMAGFFVSRLWTKKKSIGGSVGLGASCFGLLVGLFLLFGAVTYQIRSAQERAAFPRQGQLVDVGGYDINVWCEGEAYGDQPTIVFVPGGYAPGLAAYPMHKAWRETGRSCLIDRAGTGWSDSASTPRTIKNIAAEFERALAGSGERGPFVLVGHSLGGLVSANWAARSELGIVGLVVLDPTPLEMISTGGIRQPGGWCYVPESGAAIQAALSAFGFGHVFPSLHPLNSPAYLEQNASISEALPTLKAMLSSPREIKTVREHFAQMCFGGFEVIRAPGALGDLPILSIVQSLQIDDSERAQVSPWNGITDDLEWRNYKRSMEIALQEYPAFSSRSRLIGLPDPSWGHNFPVSHPGYVAEQLRGFIAGIDTWPGQTQPMIDDTAAGPGDLMEGPGDLERE
ncbi:MAG: alpha/beta hydrolase [Pseudomonadota bacterium]